MNRQELLDLIVALVPRAFFGEVFRRLAQVVLEARSSVENDTRFDRQEWRQIEGQIRFAMSFKQLRDAASAAGLECEDYVTPRGSFMYPVVSSGRFVLTVSAIPAVGDLPVASEYRASLAETLNNATAWPSLFHPQLAAIQGQPVYGIIVYTVARSEGTAGYMGIGFPNEDYSDWIDLFSAAELTMAYDVATDVESATPDNVNPTIRRQTREGDGE